MRSAVRLIKPKLESTKSKSRQVSSLKKVSPTNKMPNSSQQDQVLYFATDFERKGFGVNFGIGKGLTNVSDDWVVKAIVGFPLN